MLRPGWRIVDGRPLYHRSSVAAGEDAPTVVHVHGFGISGTYMLPTAELLAPRYRSFVPDLPGHGRSMRLDGRITIPRLARSLAAYCEEVGVERATFVGNSLGCAVICELATEFPDLVERVVLVSPAGGPNNQPLRRAVMQMSLDGPREPLGMVPIAVRDYLHFGALTSLHLFAAMARFPAIERARALHTRTLVIAGVRDPLVRLERVQVFHGMQHIHAVTVPGAHALNFSNPEVIAALIEAHAAGTPLHMDHGPLSGVTEISVPA
jgi:pimeloyl-ACP methyl ester carboxylesterase